ncbi:hypothetical protein E4U41_000125 [Claviceps citrina]|nr:hypothetical protein E4U41_000125 [Claviceps citrina]
MDSLRVNNRPFRPASVGTCHVQTATDRFGPEAKSAILDRERIAMNLDPEGAEWPILNWPPSDSEDGDGDGDGDGDFDHVPATSIYKLIPCMQRFRNNLTALSQKYNLYLVAYRSRIYVYVPRSGPRQTIPQRPDAEISTSSSPVGRIVGGYIDPDAAHNINHIVVGSLGEEEVVVTCHDDGDVTALYTKDIAEYALSSPDIPPAATPRRRRTSWAPAVRRAKAPKPFFRENVGASAWGIAIHQHSRLIAISSNRAEITVFAPALATPAPQTQQSCDCDSCCEDVEERIRCRARNWRIVVVLGLLASNLPNISFLDDKYGNADKISAVDILGTMWVAEIWKRNQAVIRVMPSASPLLKSEKRGWGILALANKHFLTVHSEEELLGAPLEDVDMMSKIQSGSGPPMVNMARYIRAIPDNPCQPSLVPASADVADDETMADVTSDDGLQSAGSSGETEVPSDYDDEVLHQSPQSDESSNGEDDGDEDEEEEEEQDDDGDEESSPMDADGGVLLDSDGSPEVEVADEQTEESVPTPAAEPPAAATVMDMVLHSPAASNMSTANVDPPQSEIPDFTHDPLLWTDFFRRLAGSQCSMSHDVRVSFSHCLRSKTLSQDDSPHLDMTFIPHIGQVCLTPAEPLGMLGFFRRQLAYNPNGPGYASGLGKAAERYHMLRTYKKGFELRPLNKPDQRKGRLLPPEYGVLCLRALTIGRPLAGVPRGHFRATARLSMVMHIPELHLIVIGSPIGRVMLVTPTRLARPVEKGPAVLHHGLRLEWVLPRRSDEAVFRTDMRPLHGMAVGPVLEDGVMGRSRLAGTEEEEEEEEEARGKEAKRRWGAMMPRRYRLMLHYRNHDIATYELSREEETGKVCIF